jgi:hypothetical protein
LGLEKSYLIVSVRVESELVRTLEMLDDESTPQAVLMTIYRMKTAEYLAMGKPTAGDKIKLTAQVLVPAAPATA